MRGQPVHEVRNEGLESDRVSQKGEDVQEDNALFVKRSACVGNHHAKGHSFNIPSWASQGTVSRDSSSTRRQPWSRKGRTLEL